MYKTPILRIKMTEKRMKMLSNSDFIAVGEATALAPQKVEGVRQMPRWVELRLKIRRWWRHSYRLQRVVDFFIIAVGNPNEHGGEFAVAHRGEGAAKH